MQFFIIKVQSDYNSSYPKSSNVLYNLDEWIIKMEPN